MEGKTENGRGMWKVGFVGRNDEKTKKHGNKINLCGSRNVFPLMMGRPFTHPWLRVSYIVSPSRTLQGRTSALPPYHWLL
jgi:hypothetical protein